MRTKKLIAALAAALALLLLAGNCAAVGTGRSFAFDTPEDGEDPSFPKGEAIFEDEPALSAAGDADRTVKRAKGGDVTVTLTDPGPEGNGPAGPVEPGVAVIRSTEKLSATAPGAAALDLLYTPDGEGSPTEIKVIVSFVSGTKTLVFRDRLKAGVRRTLYCDLSDLGKNAKINSFSVSAEWKPTGAAPGTLTFSEIRSADGAVFDLMSRMSSRSLSVDSGAAAPNSGGLKVTPENGTAELSGALDPDGIPSDGIPSDGIPSGGGDGGRYVYYAEIRLAAASGSVSAEFFREGGPSDRGPADAPQNSASIPVRDGEFSYMFRIPYGCAENYTLTLRSSDNSPFNVKYIKIRRAAEDDLAGEAPCTVTRNEIADGTLFYEGKLTKSASVRYVGQKVSLCTAPFSGGDVTVIAAAKATNTFSFKVSLKGVPQGGYENLYWLEVGEGDGGGIPITKKQFPAAPKVAEGTGRVFGLHGADPAGVFETGVPRVIVDVDLDALTGGSHSLSAGLAVSRGSSLYYVDGGAISRLDSDVKFYANSGVEMYLRFLTDEPAEWLLRDGETEEDDKRGLDMYLAVVSFLCGRYGNISSVIIPDVYGASADDPWEVAYSAALLARLTSSAASRSGDPVFVTVPVASGSKDGTAEVLAAFTAEALSGMGPVPWSVISFSGEREFPEVDLAVSAARANGTSFPAFAAVCWVPEPGTSAKKVSSGFLEMCSDSSHASVRAVFLSLSSVEPDGLVDDFSVLSPPRSDGKSRTEHLGADAFSPNGIRGSATLWDFSHSYSAGGWTAGTGVTSFGTVSRGDGGERALRCCLGEDDAFGIALCTIPEKTYLTRAPLVEFDLTVSAGKGAEIVFLFGGDGGRTEYSARVAGGTGALRVMCDLTKSGNVEKPRYVAVMIRSEGEVTVDFTRIACHSATLTSEEIIGAEEDGNKPFGNLPAGPKRIFFLLSVTVAAAGAVLLAIRCIRSDRDFTPSPARRRTSADKKS